MLLRRRCADGPETSAGFQNVSCLPSPGMSSFMVFSELSGAHPGRAVMFNNYQHSGRWEATGILEGSRYFRAIGAAALVQRARPMVQR
jgi:hypothetical protein